MSIIQLTLITFKQTCRYHADEMGLKRLSCIHFTIKVPHGVLEEKTETQLNYG